jgi:hypothetical protein
MALAIETLKIRTKLTLLVMPLLVSLCALSLAKVWVFWAEKNQYALSASVVSEVATLGQLVHDGRLCGLTRQRSHGNGSQKPAHQNRWHVDAGH